MLLVFLAAMAMADEPASPPAASQPTPAVAAATSQPAGAKPAGEKEKLICKTEPQLGSKFGKRVCRTPEQIQQSRDESRKTVMDMQFNNHTFPRN